jgi:two-component system, repressor protein LuxO
MNALPTVLLVEDNAEMALLYQAYLREEACQVAHVDSGARALDFINDKAPEVVLLDLGLPDMDGMEILEHIHREQIASAVVIVTAQGSVDNALRAMQYNALDFLEKPFSGKRLIVTVRNALKHQRLNRIVSYYQANERSEYYGFIGNSLSMQAVYRSIESIAVSKAPVFISGESGTGKELCAQAIHSHSKRREQTLIALNCAVIPKDLLESEIFGHVKGAFTGASNTRAGAAERADGGSLFLDEISELPLDLQSKLLRFVQTGTFQKLGSDTSQQVDVRFICATNREPLELVRAGKFREDLFYRLHVLPIQLPPLRERDRDVILIAQHFLRIYAEEEGKNFKHIQPDAEALLLRYGWPGNVRELQNVIRNCVVLHDGDDINAAMLPAHLSNPNHAQRMEMGKPSLFESVMDHFHPNHSAEQGEAEAQIQALAVVERSYIERAIDLCDGNISRAAKCLDINPSTIYRKLQQWREQSPS